MVNLESAHIIVMVAIAVLLLFAYLIALTHTSKSKTRLSDGDDIITRYIDFRTEELKHSKSPLSFKQYISIMILSFFAFGTAGFVITKNGFFAVVFAVIGTLTPKIIIEVTKAKRRKKFEDQYAQSLEQLSSSLRISPSIKNAVQDVVNCKFIAPSLRAQYSKLNAELALGVSVADAFKHFAEDTESIDAKDMALAIDIQNEIGGHEADIVQGIASNIRERIMLRREVQTLFSSTTTLIYIMDIVPLAAMILFFVANPTYMQVYTSNFTYISVGIILLVMPLVGSLLTHRKIADLRKEM